MTNSDAPLTGQVAVVTGSSSGLGRAIALALATAGADVVVHGRLNRSGAEETAKQIRDRGRECLVLMADLSDEATHESLVDNAWAWQSGVHIWVNNAGVDVLTTAHRDRSFEEKLELLWQVDVLATMRLARMIGKRMVARAAERTPSPPGLILNIGWDQVEHGMAGESGEMFCAIKGAVIAFSRSLARSLAPHVRVNCLAPGWIRTAWGDQASEYWQARATRESLLARWGTPEDVGQVAAFLASPGGAFVNGQTIAINGGFHFG